MRKAITLLATLLLAAAPAFAQEATTTEAKAILDGVEKRLEAMQPGDRTEASQLITLVNDAKSKLNASKQKTTPDWRNEATRANDLDGKVRAKAGVGGGAGPAGGPQLSSGQKYELKKLTDAFAAQSRTLQREPPTKLADEATAKKYRDAAASHRAALGKYGAADHPQLKQHYDDLAAYEKMLDEKVAAAKGTVGSDLGAIEADVAAKIAELDKRPATDLVDRAVERSYRDAIAQHRAKLAGLGAPDRPDVKGGLDRVAALEKRLEERVAEGRKIAGEQEAAEQKDVGQAVELLDSYFDAKSFTCEIAPPYTEERVREWVANLRSWTESKTKGTALLDKLVKEHPKYENDPRVRRLRWWFGEQLPKLLERGIGKVTTGYQDGSTGYSGEWMGTLESRAYVLDPKNSTEERLADDRHVAELKKNAGEAIVAGRAMRIFRKDFEGRDDPELDKKIAAYEGLFTKIEGGAEAALKNARLPAARMTDASLEKIARAAIERGGWAAPERVVITSDQIEKRKYLEWQGDTLCLYDFDQFYVMVAEKVGADSWMVQYRLRFFRSANSVTSLGKWVVNERIQSRRILAENVGK